MVKRTNWKWNPDRHGWFSTSAAPLISASSRELARRNCVLRHTHGGGLCSLRWRKLTYRLVFGCFFIAPFTWWHRGAARAIQLWNILCTRRYKWELLRILAEHLAQSERPSWIQVERTWDLVRDSGQRKLTYSSQNHCTSSRSVYLSRRLYSHWERLVITHHLQKWESSPTKIKPVKWIRLQILYAACSSLRIPYSLI